MDASAIHGASRSTCNCRVVSTMASYKSLYARERRSRSRMPMRKASSMDPGGSPWSPRAGEGAEISVNA